MPQSTLTGQFACLLREFTSLLPPKSLSCSHILVRGITRLEPQHLACIAALLPVWIDATYTRSRRMYYKMDEQCTCLYIVCAALRIIHRHVYMYINLDTTSYIP